MTVICPYCSQSIHLNKTLSTAVQSGGNPQTQVNFVGGECPSCHGIIVICSSLIKGVANDDECRRAMVFPKNRAVRLVSPDIPHELAEDFVEACAVLDVSPKASAALSRRLLQRTLHERFSINRPNLQQEILEFISTLNPPSHLAQQLDAIRSVGNFAAHPIKDTTTGAITDVEEGEAELLIETLESLFDYSFVQPAKWSATKAAINAKLSAAGKPTIP
jgi:hypothetical protein